MACGALAMQASGIEIDKYIAYEVDKYAIQTAQHNFPFIEERGDVFKADFTEYAGFDYLIGGSPCTYWSIAQTKNRETVASGMGWELFSQYVRALREAKPRYFLYENNKSMSAAIRASITATFGFEPICINSALVSAQNRQRLYWCGIRQADGSYIKAEIEQPADRGILLKDILETGAYGVNVFEYGKAHVLKANYNKMSIANFFNGDKGMNYAATGAAYCVAQRGRYDENGKVYQHYEAQPTVAESVQPLTEKEIDYMIRDHQDKHWSYCNKPGQEDKSKCLVANVHKGVPYNILAEPICVNSKSGRAGVEGLQPSLQDRVYDTAGKTPAVTSSFNPKIAEPVNIDENSNAPIYEVKDGYITVKGNKYPIKLVDGFYIIRKLTVRECMRLQTVPEWYEWPVSKSQAYKMLGNGWTVEVIAHLLRGLK